MRRRGLGGVPLVDGGVELHTRIAALPSRLGDLLHQVAGAIDLGHLAGADVAGCPVLILHHRLHEIVADAHAVVGVLEEDGAVRLAIDGRIVAGIHQRPGLALFLGLALDELDDVGVLDVQNHHLGGATRLAAGLDDAGKGVVTLHE